jgi:hypothetical protein
MVRDYPIFVLSSSVFPFPAACRAMPEPTPRQSPARSLFARVDDIRNRARHMSERGSMPMAGPRLALDIVTPAQTGFGATCR